MFLNLHYLHYLHKLALSGPARASRVGVGSVGSAGQNKPFFSAMPATTKAYRYDLPKKSLKADCPQCGPKHRKTLSRYVDTQTGEPLPEEYGRCDRVSNCGYHLSPYHKGPSGMSYADRISGQNQMPPIPKEWFRWAGKWKRDHITRQSIVSTLTEMQGATPEQAEYVANYVFDKVSKPAQTPPPPTVYTLPDEVFTQSLGHYERNQFARLLRGQFGVSVADELLQRFQIGTSARWPGACVFWLLDGQHRPRAGQVVLFADDWHKARYTDRQGETKVCISSVSQGLLRRYRQQGQPAPDWLTDYDNNAPRWPILFGLHQLRVASVDQPVAIVEAPKTAVVCSAKVPGFVWLAVGAKSYLNAERLAPLRGRRVMLYPDLNAYHDTTNDKGHKVKGWLSIANELNTKGFDISVSDLLEHRATDEQKQQGLDLADFLLMSGTPRPYMVFDGRIIEGEPLAVKPCNTYPAEWDEPNPLGAVPTIRQHTFHEWQQMHPTNVNLKAM